MHLYKEVEDRGVMGVVSTLKSDVMWAEYLSVTMVKCATSNDSITCLVDII